MPRLHLLAAVLALALSAAGCQSGGGAEAAAAAGEVHLTLTVDGSALAPGAPDAWARLAGTTEQGTPWDAWIRAAPGAAGYTAIVRVPAGSYAAGARLFAGGALDPAAGEPDLETAGEVPLTVAAGTSQSVALLLSLAARKAPAKPPNTAPTVYAIVATPPLVDSADPAAVVSLSASARDPDVGDRLTYAWTAVDALRPATSVGSFKNKSAQSTSWAPPRSWLGTVLFTATAIDLRGARGSLSTTVQVAPLALSGNVAVTVGVNRAPDVAPIDAARAQLEPLGLTTLAALALDPDGDPLSFAWSDGGCGGAFDAGGLSSTTAWRAPALPQDCTLSVTVSDLDPVTGAPRGLATTSTLVVHVVTLGGRGAPQFLLAARAPAGPISAGPVWFRVAAVEATADPAVTVPVAALAWTDGTGRAGAFTPEVAGAWDAVAWTPPPCPPGAAGPVPLTVAATATGSSGAVATQTFPIDLQCP